LSWPLGVQAAPVGADSGSVDFSLETRPQWAGFWGTDAVVQHSGDLYKVGSFRIDPDYSREKVVDLSQDVAQTCVPLSISVAYAGQTSASKPFITLIESLRIAHYWRMPTDIRLPVSATQWH
jgi:hypothetical protein